MHWIPSYRCPSCRLPIERWLIEEIIYARGFPATRCPYCRAAVRVRLYCGFAWLLPWGAALVAGGMLFAKEFWLGVGFCFVAPALIDLVLPWFIALRELPEKESGWTPGEYATWTVTGCAVWRSLNAMLVFGFFRDAGPVPWWSKAYGFNAMNFAVMLAVFVLWVYVEVARKWCYVRWEKARVHAMVREAKKKKK